MIYLISSECPALVDAIPLAIHDEDKNIEDVKKIDQVSDDVLDCWRYGLKSMLSGGAKPQSAQVSEKLQAVAGFHEKSMLHRFIQQKMKSEHRVLRLRR